MSVMKRIEDSIVAEGKSKIKNVRFLKTINKSSFWLGFLSGIFSSLIASLIFHYVSKLLK